MTTWMRRLRLTATALLLSSVLGACTAGFVYNRVDLLVSWYVDGLVSLDDEQTDRLREAVRQTLSWHRQTQIPKLIGLFDAFRLQLQAPVTAEIVAKGYEEIAALMDVTAARVMPDAAALLLSLSPSQLDELAASLEEDNEDLRQEYSGVTPELRQARRTKVAVRMLQRFVGRLSTGQRALVESRMATLHDNSDAWLERRRQWQQQLFALLRDHPPLQQFETGLREMVLDPNQFDSPEYRIRVEDNRRIIMRMLADVINGLDSRQKTRLTRKLAEYTADIREIAERG